MGDFFVCHCGFCKLPVTKEEGLVITDPDNYKYRGVLFHKQCLYFIEHPPTFGVLYVLQNSRLSSYDLNRNALEWYNKNNMSNVYLEIS